MLHFDEDIVSPQKQDVFHRLMSGAGEAVYVLGRNKYAERVFRVLPVEAVVDDFTRERVYLGRPVIRVTDLPRDCTVVSCVVAGNSLTALDRLRSTGVQRLIDYFTLSRLAPTTFSRPDYCSRNREEILENTDRYAWVYDHLADDASRQHFVKVVQFRLSLDVEVMRGLSLAIDRQYFEEFVPLGVDDVFGDGGGYDGQTTLR